MYTASPMAEINENVSPDYTNINIPDTLLQAVHINIPDPLLRAVNRSNPSQSSPGRKMLKVPSLLRQEKNNQHEYDPMVVSIGPYHHGGKELQLAEDFKVKAFEMLVKDSGKDVSFFYSKVFEKVNDARNCYIIDDSTSQYDDPNFAQMMLLDACFIINYVATTYFPRNYYLTMNSLGHLIFESIQRDLFLLENQIPFWLVKYLICLGYGKPIGEQMLNDYLNATRSGDYKQTGIDSILFHFRSRKDVQTLRMPFHLLNETLFGENKQTGIASSDVHQPFHLLDAIWQILVSEDSMQTVSGQNLVPNILLKLNKNCITLLKTIEEFPCQWGKRTDKDDVEDYRVRNHMRFRISFNMRASELKSSGIHFRPRSGNLFSMRFTPGILTAKLEVPIWCVSRYTKGFFINMIAYEHCANTDRAVTAYIEFMKALIDNPKDVRELREKKILLTTLGSDEDVVKVYKELNTYGSEYGIFEPVKWKIQAHCNNKVKTWLGQLIYTYFRTPWTVIALLSATFLLVLTFLQTYFTLNPRNG